MFFRKKPQPQLKEEKRPESIYSILSGFSMDTAQQLAQYNAENAIKLAPPAPSAQDGVGMDAAPTITPSLYSFEAINPVTFAHFVATGQFIGYPAMAVIAQNWLVRKGCEAKPRDAIRKGWDIGSGGDNLTPEQIKEIKKLDRQFKIKNNVVEACTFNNIFGIRHVLFKHTNPDFDYSKPFNPEEFKSGGYAGIAQIDPNRLTPEFENNDLMDATSINYMEPTWYQINCKKIHRSHFVILRGDYVPDILKPTYRYGGISKTQKVYERVYAAERTANEAPQLVMTKRQTWRKADLDKIAAKPSMFASAMQKLVELRNNFGVQLVGKDEEIGQLDTALSDLQQVIMGQYQLVCAILDVPASKLLGTGHNGFSTGETDSDYYIESLEELQANEMTDIITAHYARLVPSYAEDLGISAETELYPEWRPLKVMSDQEIAAINLQNRQADQIAFASQAIDNYELRERLLNDPYSGFDNLEPVEEDDEDLIENDGDQVDGEAQA